MNFHQYNQSKKHERIHRDRAFVMEQRRRAALLRVALEVEQRPSRATAIGRAIYEAVDKALGKNSTWGRA